MSLQDDVFDVKDALKRKPEREAFARIEEQLWAYEVANERYERIFECLRSGFSALQAITQTDA